MWYGHNILTHTTKARTVILMHKPTQVTVLLLGLCGSLPSHIQYPVIMATEVTHVPVLFHALTSLYAAQSCHTVMPQRADLVFVVLHGLTTEIKG